MIDIDRYIDRYIDMYIYIDIDILIDILIYTNRNIDKYWYIYIKSDTQLLFIIHSAAVCSKVERDNRKREERESVCLAKPTATHDNLPGEPSQPTPTHQD